MRVTWLAVVGLVLLVARARSDAVPTPDTMVVTRVEEGESSTLAASTPAQSTVVTEEPTPAIKLTDMEVTSHIALRYANTAVVTSVRNPAKRAQEATFRVLLPETAFISGFTMILDGKPYKAYVKEKEEAKQIYNQAVSQGLGAAHVATKARDSNHFTVSVNVEPNTVAVFNLTYEELLVRRHNVYNHAINLHPGALVPKLTVTVNIKEQQKITTLRVPEVRTGNEIDATEEDAQSTKAVIERSNNDHEVKVVFKPTLEEQERLINLYREKTKETRKPSFYYGYNPDEDENDKDTEGVLGQFVVQYDVERPKDGEILVNDGYFVHFFAPSDLPPLNKHVVFVLDTSGSMSDRKIVQLREAMHAILGELNQGDYFNIVEFSTAVKVHDLKDADKEPETTNYSYFFNAERGTDLVPPSKVTPDNIAKANVIVGRLSASGGTNIYTALDVAVTLTKKGVGWTGKETHRSKGGHSYPGFGTTPPPFFFKQTTTTEAITETENKPEDTKTSEVTKTPEDTKETEDTKKSEDTTKSEDTKKSEDTTKLEDTQKPLDTNRPEPIIIFLTDGDPTVGEVDTGRIISHISEANAGDAKASIFSLAFGEDADRKFLRKLSLKNDGFMRHIYEAADAALQLRAFYQQVSSPLLADVKFIYPKKQIKEGSITKHKFQRYYAGSETVVAGRVADDAIELTPEVRGFCGVDDLNSRRPYEVMPKVPIPAKKENRFLPLERLWAHLTVKQLLDEKDSIDGADDEDDQKSPHKKALEIALKYEFVTPLTSLVVVKPNASDAVDAESVDRQAGAGAIGGFGGGYGGGVGSLAFGAPLAGPLPVYAPAAFIPAPSLSLSLAAAVPQSLGFGLPGPPAPMFQSMDVFGEELAEEDGVADKVGTASAFGLSSIHSRFPQPNDDIRDIDHSWIPTTARPVLTTQVTSTAAPDALAVYHLQDYEWLRPLLSNDAITLQVNATSVTMELSKDDVPTSLDGKDPECAVATDGAAGACVYLTRCAGAAKITAQDYYNTYCFVNDKYAGICCPKSKVVVQAKSN